LNASKEGLFVMLNLLFSLEGDYIKNDNFWKENGVHIVIPDMIGNPAQKVKIEYPILVKFS